MGAHRKVRAVAEVAVTPTRAVGKADGGQAGALGAQRPLRDRYFGTLRALAYHAFGWAWAGMVFPSMGVMFGLAGSLMAKSLERPALTVVRSRMRRLLPPFWFWGVFVVLAMLVHGWLPGWQIVFWVVPLGDPPGNAWGQQASSFSPPSRRSSSCTSCGSRRTTVSVPR